MAHNEIELLKVLLSLLDYERNDIYLHIDAKAEGFEISELMECVKKSKLFIVEPRIDVKWGNFSQIECEYRLLERATPQKYMYYHMMSGVDLPLKTQGEIHQFFDENYGTEYIQFESSELTNEEKDRVSKYHFIAKRKNNIIEKILYKVSLMLQLKIDRTKKSPLEYRKGANWFSITDDLAQYVVKNKKIIEKYFRYTICGDELFLQSLVYSSEYRKNISENNFCDNYETIKYVIDWKRGNPYVFRESDFEQLVSSGQLFARKFSWNLDKRIVEKIKEYILLHTDENETTN
jgi:hypothetical protein